MYQPGSPGGTSQMTPVAQNQWIPDSQAPACMICKDDFGAFTRRHHCRYCGRVVCARCTQRKLRWRGSDQRVCDDCLFQAQLRQQGQQQQPAAAGYGGPLASSSPATAAPPPQQPYPQAGQPYPQAGQPYPQAGQPYGSPAAAAAPAPQPYQQPPPGAQPQPYAQPQQPQPYGQAPPPPQQQPPPPGPAAQPYGQAPPPPQQQPPPQPYAQPPAGGPPGMEEALQAYAQANEIKPVYMPSLRHLTGYDVVVICDDSGSMSGPADPEIPNVSRWAELQQSMQILLAATSAMGKSLDVYFINRGVFHGVTSYDDLRPAFQRPPSGGTNTVRVLRRVWEERVMNPQQQRPIIVHLFTDGHPTDDNFNEDIAGFARWMRSRPHIDRTFIAILLCTDDEDVCDMYRPLEYRVRGRFGWKGPTQGIQGVDVTEDYRGELRDIRRLRGSRFPFSMGDYIVKCLVGAIDPAVHAIDLPAGASIYGVGGGGGGLFTSMFS